VRQQQVPVGVLAVERDADHLGQRLHQTLDLTGGLVVIRRARLMAHAEHLVQLLRHVGQNAEPRSETSCTGTPWRETRSTSASAAVAASARATARLWPLVKWSTASQT
jgi:hypothetical protein